MNPKLNADFMSLALLDVCERDKTQVTMHDESTRYIATCLQLATTYDASRFHRLLREVMAGKTLDDAIIAMNAVEIVTRS